MSIAYMRTLAPSCRSQKSQSASPRRPRLFGAAAAAAAALYLTTVPLSARETVHEHTRVIDGDTIVINKERIRLKGIDAPELSQTCTKGTEVQMCGVQAKDAVVQWIRDADGDIECEGQGRDRYDRLLATCKIGGKDVGGRLVEEGFAVAYARGIWSTRFEMPEDFRRGQGTARHRKISQEEDNINTGTSEKKF